MKRYPRTKQPKGFNEATTDVMRSRINFIIDHQVNLDASPGFPYAALAKDNAELMDNCREFVVSAVLNRLHLLATTDTTGMTPRQLIEQGLMDPVRFFIKNEPHSLSKQKSLRYRLISSVSIVDQLVERLLCNTQNKAEIAEWSTCPSAPGLGLSEDKDLETIWHIAEDHISNMAEADVTGFDWSVQDWELKADALMRLKLMGAKSSSPVAKIMMARVYCLSNSVYCLSDGTMLSQDEPGIQLSGSFNTSSTNSRIRVLIALLVGADWAYAMGDDCIEDYIENAKEKYATLGHPLKFYEKCKDSFEFCSSRFKDGKAHPVDGTKTLFRLLTKKRLDENLILQFEMDMRHSPKINDFRKVIAAHLRQNPSIFIDDSTVLQHFD